MCLSKPNQTKHVGQWKRGKHSRHGVLQLLWGARLKNMLGTGKKTRKMGMDYISLKMETNITDLLSKTKRVESGHIFTLIINSISTMDSGKMI
mmetsp:Transcript_5025/g.7329  ORF Transcript_5025/g.7329 Transcript_5025/m.7329 type:complete len:93 (-) Transcript_5025:25-303(-)